MDPPNSQASLGAQRQAMIMGAQRQEIIMLLQQAAMTQQSQGADINGMLRAVQSDVVLQQAATLPPRQGVPRETFDEEDDDNNDGLNNLAKAQAGEQKRLKMAGSTASDDGEDESNGPLTGERGSSNSVPLTTDQKKAIEEVTSLAQSSRNVQTFNQMMQQNYIGMEEMYKLLVGFKAVRLFVTSQGSYDQVTKLFAYCLHTKLDGQTCLDILNSFSTEKGYKGDSNLSALDYFMMERFERTPGDLEISPITTTTKNVNGFDITFVEKKITTKYIEVLFCDDVGFMKKVLEWRVGFKTEAYYLGEKKLVVTARNIRAFNQLVTQGFVNLYALYNFYPWAPLRTFDFSLANRNKALEDRNFPGPPDSYLQRFLAYDLPHLAAWAGVIRGDRLGKFLRANRKRFLDTPENNKQAGFHLTWTSHGTDKVRTHPTILTRFIRADMQVNGEEARKHYNSYRFLLDPKICKNVFITIPLLYEHLPEIDPLGLDGALLFYMLKNYDEARKELVDFLEEYMSYSPNPNPNPWQEELSDDSDAYSDPRYQEELRAQLKSFQMARDYTMQLVWNRATNLPKIFSAWSAVAQLDEGGVGIRLFLTGDLYATVSVDEDRDVYFIDDQVLSPKKFVSTFKDYTDDNKYGLSLTPEELDANRFVARQKNNRLLETAILKSWDKQVIATAYEYLSYPGESYPLSQYLEYTMQKDMESALPCLEEYVRRIFAQKDKYVKVGSVRRVDVPASLEEVKSKFAYAFSCLCRMTQSSRILSQHSEMVRKFFAKVMEPTYGDDRQQRSFKDSSANNNVTLLPQMLIHEVPKKTVLKVLQADAKLDETSKILFPNKSVHRCSIHQFRIMANLAIDTNSYRLMRRLFELLDDGKIAIYIPNFPLKYKGDLFQSFFSVVSKVYQEEKYGDVDLPAMLNAVVYNKGYLTNSILTPLQRKQLVYTWLATADDSQWTIYDKVKKRFTAKEGGYSYPNSEHKPRSLKPKSFIILF